MANHFTAAANGIIQPGWHITAQNGPPASGAAAYTAWPATAFASFDIARLVANSYAHEGFALKHAIWVNRVYRDTANPTGAVGGWFNPRFSSYLSTRVNVSQGGVVREARWNYTTMAKADGATVAQVMRSCGYTNAEIATDVYVAAGGWGEADILEWVDMIADAASLFVDSSGAGNPNEFWAATDGKIWMPPGRIVDCGDLVHGRHIELDFERQDGATEAETTALITHICGLVHAKGIKLSIWANSPGSGGSIYSGLTGANIATIADLADEYSMIFWNDGTKTFEQLSEAVWAEVCAGGEPDPSKLEITFALGDPSSDFTTLQDARYARRFAQLHGLRRIKFWRNGAVQGSDDPSDDVNQKIAALALGANVPRPGITRTIL